MHAWERRNIAASNESVSERHAQETYHNHKPTISKQAKDVKSDTRYKITTEIWIRKTQKWSERTQKRI